MLMWHLCCVSQDSEGNQIYSLVKTKVCPLTDGHPGWLTFMHACMLLLYACKYHRIIC